MQMTWNDKDPIYRQLRDRIVALMLEGVFSEGEALPSVRHLAKEQRINPLTVSKAFQMLVDDGLVEKKRGLGMFVVEGTGDRLLKAERDLFLNEEWPRIKERIQRLGLSERDLIKTTSSEEGESA